MKIKSQQTTISYAGRQLIQPGGYFDGAAFNDSFSTTTRSVELVGGQHVSLENHGNVEANRNFSFLYDFESVEDAFRFKIDAENHALQNPIGDLIINIDSLSVTLNAGLTQIDSDISLAANSVRLILRYAFITNS